MDIVTRKEWGAKYADGMGPAPLPAEFLFLHHTATSPHTPIRDIEKIGQSRFGYGISYTFLVAHDGAVYEGHSIGRKGTHTAKLNSRARAICCIGDYQASQPSDRMLASIVELVVDGHRRGWWPNQITGGHRNAPGAQTACPGDRLYDRIPDLNRLITARLTPPEDDMPWTDTDSANLAAVKNLLEQMNHHISAGADKGGRLARITAAVEAIRSKVVG